MGSSFSIDDLAGTITLDERGEMNEHYWSKTNLLDGESHELDLSVCPDDEDEHCISFELSAYHVENEETKRAFHLHLRARLDHQQVQHLHGYLSYLLQHEMKAGNE